jgi:HlyD family secretion protein
MAIDPDTSKQAPRAEPAPAKRFRRWWLWTLGLILLAGAAAATAWKLRPNFSDSDTIRYHTVARGTLKISISEPGTIQNRERVVLKSEVEGRATILFLIPEGKQVQAGDLLVELDSSQLQENKIQQQISEMNAEAAYVRERENLAIVQSQNASDISEAELKHKFAQQDLKKYLEGEYPQQLQQAEANITLAQAELERAADNLAWSETLAAEGYLTRTELEADRLAKNKCELDLNLARTKLSLLKEYTYVRDVEQLGSDLEQAKMALERTKRKAKAGVVQAEADLRAKESEFNRQRAKLEKIDEQITKCRIVAPVAGMVVYATTGQPRRWNNPEPLEEGQEVRERQELIYLPTNEAMTVDVKIHEASRHKIRPGLLARVTVDALPEKVFWGRVGKIAVLPDSSDAWLNPDLKAYPTEIEIDDGSNLLSAGMSCRVEIIVEQYVDVLSVPIQAVVRVGKETVVYIPGPNGPVRRPVEVGLDNNTNIHILRGLTEGELVLLTPPLEPSATRDEAVAEPPEMPDIPSATAPTTPPRASPTDSGDGAQPPDGANAPEAQPREGSRRRRQRPDGIAPRPGTPR